MNNLRRTTITIPQDLYEQAKIRAAYQSQSVSRFICSLLAEELGVKKETNGLGEVIGKYSFQKNTALERQLRKTIYEDYLQRKIFS